MSLYDGLLGDDKEKDANKADVSGWGSIHQMLRTQQVLQAKNKASLMQPKRKGGATLQPVIDLKNQRPQGPPGEEGPGGVPLGALHFNQATGRLERMFGGGDVPAPAMFIGSEPPSLSGQSLTGVADEYNPLRPNDYEEFVKKRKEQRAREREEERRKNPEKEKRRRFNESPPIDDEECGEMERAKKRREAAESEEEEERSPKPRRAAGGGAAIAPPSSLMEQDNVVVEKPQVSPPRPGSGSNGAAGGSLSTSFGNLGSVASKIMAKYGYKEGQGLGKKEQGMSTALLVEKTSKRGGKIIHERDIPKMLEPQRAPEIAQTNANLLKNPSKVILLRNMVGPGEVDDDLEPETAEECTKYGKVTKCVIFEIRDPKGLPVPEEEAVRIFVEFERMESAIKAVVDLNGRFFGGRIVKGCFYNLDKFRRLDLADEMP